MIVAIFLLFASICYSEVIWYLVKTKTRPYETMNSLLKFMIGLNYFIAIFSHSFGSLLCATTLSFYQLIVFKERIKQLQ